MDDPSPVRRLSRGQRREQILAAATEAFARSGFAATSLDEVAEEAAVTRAVLYRHFDSKSELYQAVLDQMCGRLDAHVDQPDEGFRDDSIDGLIAVAVESPAGFRLLFQHALREPEFRERIAKFHSDVADAAYLQIAKIVPDPALARWAAATAPIVAIDAVIAWLDAGQPDPDRIGARVRRLVIGVVEAALLDDDATLPAQPSARQR